jgi:hypothetical protein
MCLPFNYIRLTELVLYLPNNTRKKAVSQFATTIGRFSAKPDVEQYNERVFLKLLFLFARRRFITRLRYIEITDNLIICKLFPS